ncbi:hypothetical protein ACOMHN_014757 [Nucella lapillus]
MALLEYQSTIQSTNDIAVRLLLVCCWCAAAAAGVTAASNAPRDSGFGKWFGLWAPIWKWGSTQKGGSNVEMGNGALVEMGSNMEMVIMALDKDAYKTTNYLSWLFSANVVKMALEKDASKTTNYLSWLGLGMMGLQFGILARLTWWEYSWDIMEPVTYFVTYGTTMAMFGYYLLTKQEYLFPDVRDRLFLVRFHKLAEKRRLNIEQYNRLRDAIAQAEDDLRRLRDPLQLHLPIKEIQKRVSDKE